MQWTLAVSMGRKECVALVDSEDIGQQSVPNVARMVKEAKVRMARDRARKGKPGKGKTEMNPRQVDQQHFSWWIWFVLVWEPMC